MLQSQKRFSIIGHVNSFTIEERIFNTFCVIAFVAMAIEFPFNYFIGLISTAWICFFSALVAFGLYYLARVKRKFSIAVYLFGILANAVFVVNYFFNSGLRGPSLLLFALALLLTIVIIPKKQFFWWVVVNLILVFGLLIYEYFNPNAIPYAYRDSLSLFLDHGMTYFVMAILLYYTINYVRSNYDVEKRKVELQNVRISSQNEQLEKINTEKDKLFSIISHDIKSPLSSIQGYLEMLLEVDLSDEDRFEVKRRLLKVTKDTSHMIANLLVWSKSQLDKPRIDFKEIDVFQLLTNDFKVEQDIAFKKGISFRIECPQNLRIWSDCDRLQIIIRNLLNNAIKFTEEGGEILLYAVSENEKCLIKVCDNGNGIGENERKSLFQLKAHSTYGTNNEKGVGLGLALCKDLAALLNGEIWHEHNGKKGSIFAISFPTKSVISAT